MIALSFYPIEVSKTALIAPFWAQRVTPSFVLLPSSVLAVMIMNSPLSVAMASHGGIILWALVDHASSHR